MEISLKNYKTVLSPELLLKAKKGTVRECDEIEPGHYQAYVDEGDQTFDTFLMVNKKAELTNHGCDCESVSPFCHHKAALLLFVINGKKVAPKLTVGKKKAVDIESLVHEADPEKLKTWLIKLLTEHKDLAMTFTQQFAKSNKPYQPQDIKKLTLDAVKAVIKTKRSVDSTNGKKIIELWAVLHEPIMEAFCVQLADEASFLNVHAIMEACDEVLGKYGPLNGRLTKYLEKLLSKILNPLVQLKDEDIWDQVIESFVNGIRAEPFYLRIYYLNFLTQLHQLSSMERKKRLASVLVAQFMKLDANRFYDGTKYTIAVFDMVANSGLFPDHYILFTPIRYQYEYNLALIALLMEHKMYALAEKYCLEQIAANTNGQYDGGYLEFLAEIYTIQKDDKKLAEILKVGLSYDYDFNTYLFVDSVMDDAEEKSKWRKQLLAKARREAGQNFRAVKFSFLLLDYEQKYAKMFDYMDGNVNYYIIARFGAKMAEHNADRFLKLVLYRSDHYSDFNSDDAFYILEAIEQIFDIFLKHYSIETLKLILKDRLKNIRYYPANQFLNFLNDRLTSM